MQKKILFVDDETELTTNLKDYFQLKDFIVFSAISAEEAIPLFKKEMPDIAVLDMLLKGKLDGLDVLREMKKISPNIKAIMLTGSDTTAKEKEAHKLGVNRYLRKPVMVAELYKIVSEVLDLP